MSNDPIKTLKYLKAVFLVVIGLLFLLIAATPLLIRHGFSLGKGLVFEEEIIEAALIVAIFAAAFLAATVYRTAVDGYRKKLLRLAGEKNLLADRLTEAFRYIGTINVQLEETHAIFSTLKRLPENRRQFKKLLALFGNKILGMVNADWVLIRIIDRRNLRTLIEHHRNREGHAGKELPIGNRIVLEGQKVDGVTITTGTKDNLSILTACILPLDPLQKQETILLQALVDTVEMLFIISNLYPNLITAYTAETTEAAEGSGPDKTGLNRPKSPDEDDAAHTDSDFPLDKRS